MKTEKTKDWEEWLAYLKANPIGNPPPKAFFWIYRNDEDILLRDLLESSCTKFQDEDGDETYFRFWDDDGHKIRSCLECGGSQFKSPEDGLWIVYWTPEHQIWVCNEIQKGNYDVRCSLCEKWFYRDRKN